MKTPLLACGLLTLTVATSDGCALERQDRQMDLQITLSRHHLDIRWGRIPNAARFVHPDLQAAFIEDWTRNAEELEITDIDVLQVLEAPDGNSAEVTVRYSYIERQTLSVRSAIVVEKWERTESGHWLVMSLADPRAQHDPKDPRTNPNAKPGTSRGPPLN